MAYMYRCCSQAGVKYQDMKGTQDTWPKFRALIQECYAFGQGSSDVTYNLTNKLDVISSLTSFVRI